MTPEELQRLFDDLGAQHGPPGGALPAPAGGDRGGHRPAETHPPAAAGRPGRVTSDLTIDETLLLHSLGWEPRDLVIGAAVGAIPGGTFTWGASGGSSTDWASRSLTMAVQAAAERIQADTRRAGGAGVIGVEVDITVHQTVAHATLVGTAVAPTGGRGSGEPFVSDLSVRDFCLLHQAGWRPLGLAFGAAFVQAPYRSVGQALRQAKQNVELTNLTNALYQARELAMERMQEQAIHLGAGGVVAVQVVDRPVPFASHVVQFTAWGTSVRLDGPAHTYLRPRVVVDLDDPVDRFDLGGAMGAGGA